jgi:Mn2+/Fe2+ NRAMP family transporter
MGEFANSWWINVLAWTSAAVIITLNLKLLSDAFGITPWIAKAIR